MNITRRQRHLIDCIERCNSLADVGCDHGYISITALLESRVDTIVLCDISAKSLDKAVQLAKQLHIDNNKYSFCCQDGLQNIDVDCAVIAGMGGLEIIAILNNAKHLPNTLVLQPMRNQVDTRRWLIGNGYNISRDYIVKDTKYYTIIVAHRADVADAMPLEELQIIFGHTNLSHPTEDFVSYIDNEISKCKKILANSPVDEIQYYLTQLQLAKQHIGG